MRNFLTIWKILAVFFVSLYKNANTHPKFQMGIGSMDNNRKQCWYWEWNAVQAMSFSVTVLTST